MADVKKLEKYTNFMDMDMDDIEDLASFSPWPTGGYKFHMSVSEKDINDVKSFELAFKCLAVVELAEAEGIDWPTPKVGDTTSILYQQTDNGIKAFKTQVLSVVGKKFNKSKFADCFEILQQGLDCVGVLKRDWNEEKKRSYMRIKEFAVV